MKTQKLLRSLNYWLKSAAFTLAISTAPLVSANSGAITLADKNSHSVATPKNGQDKQKVESSYGEPIHKVSSVGEPPISKWVYKDFTVYFEYDLVLHAVVH